MLRLMPIFLVISYPRLIKAPPQGSVVLDTFKVAQVALSQKGLKGARRGGDEFWNSAKPVSNVLDLLLDFQLADEDCVAECYRRHRSQETEIGRMA